MRLYFCRRLIKVNEQKNKQGKLLICLVFIFSKIEGSYLCLASDKVSAKGQKDDQKALFLFWANLV